MVAFCTNNSLYNVQWLVIWTAILCYTYCTMQTSARGVATCTQGTHVRTLKSCTQKRHKMKK